MAEAGVPETTMLAIMGHMSRAMLGRYSHIQKGRETARGGIAEHSDRSPSSRGIKISTVPTKDWIKAPTKLSNSGTVYRHCIH